MDILDGTKRNAETLAVLVNRRATRCPGDLRAALAPLQARYAMRLIEIERPETFSERIAEAAENADVIVIGSGDGTMARSAGALIESGLPIGVLPMGNANDLARGLGMPLEIEHAIKALVEARPREIDVGRVNGHYFFSAATIGIGARISSGMDPISKRRWKRLSQIPKILGAIRARRSFRVTVRSESSVASFPAIHVTIANGRTIGGGVMIDPSLRLDDGLLDFSSVRPQSILQLLALAPAYVFGHRRSHPRINHVRSSSMRIETSRGRDIATDGDVVTETPAEFEVVSKAVRFLVPAHPEPTLALD